MFKTKRKYIISFSLLILLGLIFLTINSFNVKAISENDLNYTFEKDQLYNSQDPIDSSFNTRDFEVYERDGIFNATYSFEDDTIGEVPIDWDDNSGTDCSATIISDLDGHKNVLQLLDESGTNRVLIYNNFSSFQTFGSIELWIRSTNVTKYFSFILRNIDDTHSVTFGIYNNFFRYYSGGWNNIISVSNNIWYHIKINFECSSGEYKGLSADTFYVWINNIRYGAYNFENVVDSIFSVKIWTEIIDTSYSYYIDAIGYYFPEYTGEHFDVGAQDNSPKAITWDGNFFWVVGTISDNVYKYYANGTYTGIYFDVSSQNTSPEGIIWDGNSFWMVGDLGDEVYQYNSTYDYTGIHFDTGAQDISSRGITWDGNSFWVIGGISYNVYQYNSIYDYTGIYFYVGAQDITPEGITWKDNSFYITGDTNNKVYKYYNNGTYTGFNFDVGTQDNSPTGLASNTTHLFMLGADNNEVYFYLEKDYYYNIGDNLKDTNYLIDSGIESDKWEFLYEGANDKFENGDDNPNGWIDQEDGEDDVNVRTGETGYVELYAMSGEALALKRESLGYTGDILLNVSFGFEIKYIYSVVHNDVYLKIYSSDDTEIVRIRIYNTGELKYWVSGTTYTQLDTGFVIDTDYDVNLFVNYNNDTCTLRYSTNEVFTDSFEFPLTTTDKSGLNKVEFGICADTDYCQVYLDYIGIYVDYHSISTEFAYHKVIPSITIDWYFDYANLLRYNAKGNISIHMYVQNYGGSFAQLSELTEVDGWKTINLYSLKVGGFSFGIAPISLYFFFKGLIELNEVDVHGVVLKQDVNEYHAICDYEGVNQHTSYFYIENNKLYFTITQDDNDLEYIRISFDVDNVLTQNYSINYNAQLTGNSLGYLTVKYTDSTLTPLSLKTYSSGINLILPQDKEINEFNVLITDDDKDSIQGITTGYVFFVKLIYLPDVSIDIIISALFEILIPLLILIIPTFLFYLRLGKAAIIPVFVLMSFICFITNLIPLWVFFVILISSGAFLILDKTVLKEVKD